MKRSAIKCLSQMANNPVAYSFYLYVLYVLLPLVPAVLVFKMFPNTKVFVRGPVQNLTINATGAFGAYIVTVALGYFLVQDIENVIMLQFTRIVRGTIDLDDNQYIDSFTDRTFSRHLTSTDSNGKILSRAYDFVVVQENDEGTSEQVMLKYWELGTQSPGAALGDVPPSTTVPIELSAKGFRAFPQRFRLERRNGKPEAVPERVGRNFFQKIFDLARWESKDAHPDNHR